MLLIIWKKLYTGFHTEHIPFHEEHILFLPKSEKNRLKQKLSRNWEQLNMYILEFHNRGKEVLLHFKLPKAVKLWSKTW